MDNRIPPILRNFIATSPEPTAVDFLSFDNWLSIKENQAVDWTIVARRYNTEFEDYYTVSCLVKFSKASPKRFLSDCHWYINSEFGMPRKYVKPYEGEKYDDGLIAKRNGVTYFPFTFCRYFSGLEPDRFQVIEHFLLYYNCFWIGPKMEFHSINDAGEITVAVKIIKSDLEETMMVDTHLLRDYLAVRGVHLARFHDHRRRSSIEIENLGKGKFQTYKLQDIDCVFELDLRTDIQYDRIKSTSRLLGKDIVNPYPAPESHDWSIERDPNEFLDFVFARDDNGKERKSTCNPELLSNYFVDRGTPHFLTAVYFKKELLHKYYAEPKKYTVSEHSVDYLSIWGIPIDLTKENLIQVYLGDLGKCLPYNEQLHWRQFNVVPKGKISEHRFRRDFLTQFSQPGLDEAPITHFKHSFKLLQNGFNEKFGTTLFLPLSKNDQHLFSTIHIPLSDEWKEFDEQLLGLGKITTDSFNNELLTGLTGRKIGDLGSDEKPIKGLLGLFYELLLQTVPDEDERQNIIYPFNMVQAMRSSSVAHRKGKELDKTLLKYGVFEFSNENRFKHIIVEVTKAVQTILSKVENWTL